LTVWTFQGAHEPWNEDLLQNSAICQFLPANGSVRPELTFTNEF
jgi:hypothetical protein